jgi:thiamine biosynthesis lipoprotein
MKQIIAIIALFLLVSCKYTKDTMQVVKFTGETQGTYYAVTYFEKDGINYQTEIDSLLHDFDLSVSMWVPQSIISKINRNEPMVKADGHFLGNFELSRKVYEKTNGAFDPTVAPLVNAWGFGFKDRMHVDKNVVDSLLPLVGFRNVKLVDNKVVKKDPHIQFDFNAVAQGYSVDLVVDFLKSNGVKACLVDIGGEVLAHGKKPDGNSWKVGIEKPKDNAAYGEGLKAIVKLENKALATSGSYRKFYEENGMRYSHTIDPKTGYPVQHSLLSVSVLADDCGAADAFATAFMVLGVNKSKKILEENPGLEAYFIYSDETGNLQTFVTKGFRKIIIEEMD